MRPHGSAASERTIGVEFSPAALSLVLWALRKDAEYSRIVVTELKANRSDPGLIKRWTETARHQLALIDALESADAQSAAQHASGSRPRALIRG